MIQPFLNRLHSCIYRPRGAAPVGSKATQPAPPSHPAIWRRGRHRHNSTELRLQMYKFRLWVELSESVEESDCGSLDSKIQDLQATIKQSMTMIRNPLDCISNINYCCVLQCSGGSNHRGTSHDSLLHILHNIATLLPGSHGMAYWSDDEDYNMTGYSVIVIENGRVYQKPDPFFQPVRSDSRCHPAETEQAWRHQCTATTQQ